MKVEQFIAWQKQRLEEFEFAWKERNKVTPLEFPLDQETGTWFERLYWFNANSSDLQDTGLND